MQTVLDALEILYPESSKNTLRSWLDKGRVTVDGELVSKAKTLVPKGKEVKVGPRVSFASEDVKILYEDSYLAVIDKPAGLLSVASETEFDRTAHTVLKRRKRGVVYPVHRLDRDTSGVMLFTYTIKAQEHLKKQFAAHTVERVYHGLIEGHLATPQGIWKSLLADDDTCFVRTSPHGELAITHYETISKRQNSSLMKFTLETGKKNQIRVHCSEAGHPIVGDKKYGSKRGSHLCLHAHLLSFEHPGSGKRLSFTTPIPNGTFGGKSKKC